MRTYARFGLLLAVVLALLVLLPGPELASGTPTYYPSSMAGLGDSITNAMNADSPPTYTDEPQYSWSVGDSSAVQSHYYRILLKNPAIAGKNYRYSVSGATMDALDSQATGAVSQGVQYVTILMGANDVCWAPGGDPSGMTSVADYRSQFQAAMHTLTTGLPTASIFVASVPDVYHLWSILHDYPPAADAWTTLGICQVMLKNPTSHDPADEARRQAARQRIIDYNTALAEVCASYPRCRFDNNALFNSPSTASDVDTFDYFHPSISGQAGIAALTWSVTFDFPWFLGPAGGIAELPEVPGSSQPPYALAGGLAAAIVAITAGAWYARRRWLR